jgi:hypothetical protein
MVNASEDVVVHAVGNESLGEQLLTGLRSTGGRVLAQTVVLSPETSMRTRAAGLRIRRAPLEIRVDIQGRRGRDVRVGGRDAMGARFPVYTEFPDLADAEGATDVGVTEVDVSRALIRAFRQVDDVSLRPRRVRRRRARS